MGPSQAIGLPRPSSEQQAKHRREPRRIVTLAPPLPGGYAGEILYYIGANFTADNGDRLVHGEQGEVMGPKPGEERLAIKFP